MTSAGLRGGGFRREVQPRRQHWFLNEKSGFPFQTPAFCSVSRGQRRLGEKEYRASSVTPGVALRPRTQGPDEIEIAVEAASVNPIDVRRADGYGRRLLSLKGASRFPMTLGNDFGGVVAAVGSGRASGFAIGERVYGVMPPSKDGTHASHVLVKAAHASKAPANRALQELAALPYCFVTMWLAAARAGVTRENAEGKEILVHGAAGGLGTLALQTLSEWGARVTAIAKTPDLSACLEAGAVKTVERERNPFANLGSSQT